MIKVGIGGWSYAPWRGAFYPAKLPQARELDYASRHLGSIEVNATFYGAQKPASFRRWADETPDGFVFSLKAPRFAVSRRRLAEAGPSIDRFFGGGPLELGAKLGPILWQLPASKAFEEEDLAAFVELLPRAVDGRPIRHALEVRHHSFRDPRFVALMRQRGAAVVLADSDEHPLIADVTGDFVYARLERTSEEEPTGYAPAELDDWARRFSSWADGGEPDDLPKLAPGQASASGPRPCFVYFISGAKVRAPAAAMALIERLGVDPR